MSLKHETLESLFIAIANVIREKTGETAIIIADDFPDEIGKITGSDPSIHDTVTSGDQILDGLTAHSKGVKYTGTIKTYTGEITIS